MIVESVAEIVAPLEIPIHDVVPPPPAHDAASDAVAEHPTQVVACDAVAAAAAAGGARVEVGFEYSFTALSTAAPPVFR